MAQSYRRQEYLRVHSNDPVFPSEAIGMDPRLETYHLRPWKPLPAEAQSERNKPMTRVSGMTLSDPAANDIVDLPRSSSTAPSTALRRTAQSHWWIWFLTTWRVELLCCLLAVMSLLGLAATLGYHQQRPLPKWPYSLTINSLISIFVLILKTAATVVLSAGLGQLKWSWFSHSRPLVDVATFDDASRGPWGAAKLLWLLKRRQIVASLAGIVMIAGLALDPLAQQLVRYFDCQQPEPILQASFPRAGSYRMTGLHTGAGTETVPVGVVSAVQAGMYDANAVPIHFTCPTGNCTAAPYGSMGWCGQCVDVSNEVMLSSYSRSAYNATYPVWNATLPSGRRAHTFSGAADFADTLSMGPNAAGATEIVYLDSAYGVDTSSTSKVQGACEGIVCPSDRDSSSSWCCRGYGAARCTSDICAKSFNTTVTGGTLKEVEISRTVDWGIGPNGGLQAVDLTCLTPSQRTRLHNLGHPFLPSTSWTPWNGSVYSVNDTYVTELRLDNGTIMTYFPHNSSTLFDQGHAGQTTADTLVSVVPYGCVYSTFFLTRQTAAGYLARAVNGTVQVQTEYLGGSDIATHLYNRSRVDYQDVAALYTGTIGSLDRFIRQNGDVNFTSPAQVVVYASSTCLRVRWHWIIFPAVFTALVLLFFFAMIAQTSQVVKQNLEAIDTGENVRHPCFKSSSLALLYHGLDPTTLTGLGERGTSSDEMERDAKVMLVKFQRSKRGWNFTEVTSLPYAANKD